MVKHIVFWKIKAELTGAARDEAVGKIASGFAALQGVIPGLRRLEVGIDFLHSAQSADFALYSEFDSRAALDGYQAHPAHQALVPLVSGITIERRVIDYEA
jgi:hypothetical protein